MNHIDYDVLISIIVPVFNNESLIGKCIESIINQTYKNWELIVVDDGSKDKSLSVCKRYEERDNRIKVIHQENQGVSQARYKGFKQANGEWITFVDSDDTIPEEALESYFSAVSDKTDIIVGWIKIAKPTEDALTIDEYRRRNIIGEGIHVGPVAHLYRRSIITDDAFNIPRTINMGEDMLMNIRISFNTNKPVMIVKKLLYDYYIENVNNVTNNHRISLDYENLFHKYRIKSIPKEKRNFYMNDIISIRIYILKQYIINKPFDNKWIHSEFYVSLINDIKQFNYKLNKSLKLLFYSHNLILRLTILLYIKLRKYI